MSLEDPKFEATLDLVNSVATVENVLTVVQEYNSAFLLAEHVLWAAPVC